MKKMKRRCVCVTYMPTISKLASTHVTHNAQRCHCTHKSGTAPFACKKKTMWSISFQVEVAETSEAVSQSAHALTQLAVLLPSHAALFGQAASHAAHRDGAVRSAGQHSRAWLHASSPSSPKVHILPLFDTMLACMSLGQPVVFPCCVGCDCVCLRAVAYTDNML